MRIKYTALEQQWKSINGHIQQRSNYIKPGLKNCHNNIGDKKQIGDLYQKNVTIF